MFWHCEGEVSEKCNWLQKDSVEIKRKKLSHMSISEAVQQHGYFISEYREMSVNGLMSAGCRLIVFSFLFVLASHVRLKMLLQPSYSG